MQCNKNSLSILVSPAFLVGLGLLLLNDFFLKPTFHNWFTGKLSDFAGLFIFPLFFTAFFSERKRWIYAVTAIGFVFWKSEFSQPLIELWNAQPYYHLDRVVDHTDLIALLILPLSFADGKHFKEWQVRPMVVYVSCVISVFAFAATSFAPQKITYYEDYKFDISQAELINRIKQVAEDHIPEENTTDKHRKEYLFRIQNSLPMTYDIRVGAPHFDSARILIIADGNGSKITLISTATSGPTIPGQKEKEAFRLDFEKKFIEALRREPVQKSPQVKMAWFRGEPEI